jgi:hypothetical protein
MDQVRHFTSGDQEVRALYELGISDGNCGSVAPTSQPTEPTLADRIKVDGEKVLWSDFAAKVAGSFSLIYAYELGTGKGPIYAFFTAICCFLSDDFVKTLEGIADTIKKGIATEKGQIIVSSSPGERVEGQMEDPIQECEQADQQEERNLGIWEPWENWKELNADEVSFSLVEPPSDLVLAGSDPNRYLLGALWDDAITDNLLSFDDVVSMLGYVAGKDPNGPNVAYILAENDPKDFAEFLVELSEKIIDKNGLDLEKRRELINSLKGIILQEDAYGQSASRALIFPGNGVDSNALFLEFMTMACGV